MGVGVGFVSELSDSRINSKILGLPNVWSSDLPGLERLDPDFVLKKIAPEFVLERFALQVVAE